MQYLGGKSRIAKEIVAQIRPHLRGRAVWDPFCGGLSVSAAFGDGLATDVCAPLIHLYWAVQNGWIPPCDVTLEQYQAARRLPDTNPMKAFAGFGCSYGGMWFGGYARGDANYAAVSARTLIRQVPRVRSFGIVDFLAENPRPINLAIYCDPPYRGTKGYQGSFDHDAFWERAEAWSRFTDVWVSEYSTPIGQLVWEKSCALRASGRGARKNPNTEKLFKL